jgi:hypothetical protein
MATPNILQIQADVQKAGIPVRGEPIVVVRPISGTNQPSQHSFGNAIDYYPTDPKQAADARRGIKVESLERLYQYLQGHSLARVVCYYKRGGCTTAHLDHVHVDATPKIRSQAHLEEVIGKGPGKSIIDRAGDAHKIGGDASTGGIIGGIGDTVSGIGDAVEAVGGFLQLVTSGEFVKRAALVVGGFSVGAAGIYFIAKEFGAPSVTQVAGAASGGVAGAAAKAVKGGG